MANKEQRVIEVFAASDILKFLDDQKKLMLRNCKIMNENADILEQAMARSAPYEPPIAKKKAKRVVRFMRLAAEDAKAQAVKMVRMQKQFKAEYADLLEPKRNRRKNVIDWRN